MAGVVRDSTPGAASALPHGDAVVAGLEWLYGLPVFRDLAAAGYAEAAVPVLERINSTRHSKLTLGEIIQGAYEHNLRPGENPREYECELLLPKLSLGGRRFLGNMQTY